MNASDFLHAFGKLFTALVMVPCCSKSQPFHGCEAAFDTAPDLGVTHGLDQKCGQKNQTGLTSAFEFHPAYFLHCYQPVSLFFFRRPAFPATLSPLRASFANFRLPLWKFASLSSPLLATKLFTAHSSSTKNPS